MTTEITGVHPYAEKFPRRNATLIRYRKASEATGSAAIFDELAGQIIAAMQSRRANKVADLFGSTRQGGVA